MSVKLLSQSVKSESARGLVLAGSEGTGCSGNQWHQEPPREGQNTPRFRCSAAKQPGNQCNGKMIVGEEQ